MMVEFVVWAVDCMGREFEEGMFASLEEAMAFGAQIGEEMCSEEDWFVECRVDGDFAYYVES